MLTVKTILHPTDFSEHSEAAFEVARGLARDYRARLILLHVLPPIMKGGEVYALITRPEEIHEELTNRLQGLRSMANGLDVETVLKEGDAAAQILAASKEMGYDLIVMGTHGRTGLSHLLMGSIAEKIVRYAACPVLTIKKPMLRTAAAVNDAASVPAMTR